MNYLKFAYVEFPGSHNQLGTIEIARIKYLYLKETQQISMCKKLCLERIKTFQKDQLDNIEDWINKIRNFV